MPETQEIHSSQLPLVTEAFPGINVDRVSTLYTSPEYQARQGLHQLSTTISTLPSAESNETSKRVTDILNGQFFRNGGNVFLLDPQVVGDLSEAKQSLGKIVMRNATPEEVARIQDILHRGRDEIEKLLLGENKMYKGPTYGRNELSAAVLVSEKKYRLPENKVTT